MSEKPEYETRVTRCHIAPKGESFFSASAFAVSIEDEGGGEFVVVSDSEGKEIRISPEEWPALRETIERMVSACAELEDDAT